MHNSHQGLCRHLTGKVKDTKVVSLNIEKLNFIFCDSTLVIFFVINQDLYLSLAISINYK